MHKTVNISIGNALFTIEESAYKTLETYLDSIRSHFGHTAEGDEIVEDIEGRVAEALSEKLSGRKKVIHAKDVTAVIEQLGTVKDFKEFEGEEAGGKTKEEWLRQLKRIRLYRDADDQIIGGVCSGIAKYFDIDPLIIRLAFGLSLFMGGFGFILYLLLWFLLPEARTTSEKVEMTGGRVTLSAIQKRIDETLPPEKRKTLLHKIFAFPFAVLRSIVSAIGTVFRFVAPLIVRLLGIGILLGCAVAFAFATFVLFALLVSPTSPYIGFPLREVVSGLEYVVLLSSIYFVFAMPVLLALLFGTSFAVLRNIFSVSTVAAIIGTWFIAVITAGVTLFSIAPKVEVAYEDYLNVQQVTTTQEYDFDAFTALDLRGNLEVTVREGAEYSVTLEHTEHTAEHFAITEEDGVLRFRKNHTQDRCILLCPPEKAQLTITMPVLTQMDINGAVRGSMEGFTQDALTLIVDGISTLEASSNVQDLTVQANGASHIVLSGTGETLHLELNGVVQMNGEGFAVQNADVNLNGPVRVSLNASQSLSGEANGPVRITWKTKPQSISLEENGPVRIGPAEDDEQREW